jgi:hypothetical protein
MWTAASRCPPQAVSVLVSFRRKPARGGDNRAKNPSKRILIHISLEKLARLSAPRAAFPSTRTQLTPPAGPAARSERHRKVPYALAIESPCGNRAAIVRFCPSSPRVSAWGIFFFPVLFLLPDRTASVSVDRLPAQDASARLRRMRVRGGFSFPRPFLYPRLHHEGVRRSASRARPRAQCRSHLHLDPRTPRSHRLATHSSSCRMKDVERGIEK